MTGVSPAMWDCAGLSYCFIPV